MDFQKHSPPPNYLNRQFQRRLLLLIVGLGAVFLLMREARRPERWQWVARLDEQQEGALQPQQQPPAAPENEWPETIPGPEMDERSTAIDGEARIADERALAAIRDNTPFQQAERAAWYGLFRQLRESDDAALQRRAESVTYLQLDKQPQVYRGDPVSVQGIVRLVEVRDDPVPTSGIERYYQVWLQPRDQPDSLIVAYCLELPQGFPLGGDLDQPAYISGYFFKRWAYQAQDGIRTAPLILARTIDWRPYRTATDQRQWDTTTLAVSISLVLVVAVLVVWLLMRRGSEMSKFDQYVRRAATGNEVVVPPEMEPASDETTLDQIELDQVDQERE